MAGDVGFDYFGMWLTTPSTSGTYRCTVYINGSLVANNVTAGANSMVPNSRVDVNDTNCKYISVSGWIERIS